MNDLELDLDSGSYWGGLASGRLLIQRCGACGRARFPMVPACPYCGGDTFETVEATGHGTVYSWITVHRALDAAFAAEVPYTVAVIELDEGPRVLARLPSNEPLTIGDAARIDREQTRSGALWFRRVAP